MPISAMLKRNLFVAALSLSACVASAHAPALLSLASVSGQVPAYSERLIAVKLKPNATNSAVTKAVKSVRGTIIRSLPQIGWRIIQLPTNVSAQTAETKLESVSAFSNVDKVATRHGFESVNDPRSNEQYSLTKMQVTNAWDLYKGDGTVTVAVLDTGVDSNHQDLKDQMLPGYDFVNNDNNPADGHGHGTHCAGIIGATTNNGVGIAGVAYNVKIMPVKVLDDVNGGTTATEAAGLIYAADQGAQIISMSLGGFGTDQLETDAIAYAYSKGAVLVAAAGNESTNLRSYPGAFEEVIGVGASDANDKQAGFSNFGADWVDVAAPGVAILSTLPHNRYESWDGTSMACPNVAGVAALVLGASGGSYTNDEVRAAIESTCDPIGNWIAFGRVNASAAVANVGTPVTDVPSPTDPAPFDGTVTYTNGSFTAEDGVSATIKSIRRAGVGLTGSFTTSFNMVGMTTDELRSATLTLRATAEKLATLQVFVQDLSGTWKMLANQPGNPSGKTTEYTINKATLDDNMTGAGSLRVMVRSYAPLRLANRVKGIAQVDLLKVTFKGVRRPGATP
ncbi:peptidase S8 [bacterium]|nr:MAG: peptidase S8 [bacterium]